jgi:hypothetical protein
MRRKGVYVYLVNEMFHGAGDGPALRRRSVHGLQRHKGLGRAFVDSRFFVQDAWCFRSVRLDGAEKKTCWQRE